MPSKPPTSAGPLRHGLRRQRVGDRQTSGAVTHPGSGCLVFVAARIADLGCGLSSSRSVRAEQKHDLVVEPAVGWLDLGRDFMGDKSDLAELI